MKTIYADKEGSDYPSCPLRTDLHTCGAVPYSAINSCPQLDEDGIFHFPEWCPLKKEGGVCIKLKEE